MKYGGNTTCIEIRGEGDAQIIINSGTGIINLARTLLGGPCGKGQGKLHILLSHVHWDHIQGFPYFIPAFIPGNHITLWGPHSKEHSAYDLMDYQMRKEYNPIFTLANMGSTIVSQNLSQHQEFEGWRIEAQVVPSSKLVSISYRITRGDSTVAVMGDMPDDVGLLPEVVEFCWGADLLIHDSISPRVSGSAAQHAFTLARMAEIPKVALTYYLPSQNDELLDRELKEISESADGIEVLFTREEMKVTV